MNILVAEDHPSSALYLRRILERQGYRVSVAQDGAEAWRLAQHERFPLIISDWLMPGLDGLQLCRRVREQEGPYTYLILLTCKQGQRERLEGLRAGADDFLVKPPDAEELAVRLEIARRILAVQEELERRNSQLADMASRDELTGVNNRRRFREILENQESLARRTGKPLSLVMLDVNHFKQYNDAYGHPAGDEALRTVATTLREGVRKHDEVARVGGEEFAILLPDTDADLARDLAGRLRGSLASKAWPLRPLTASLGVATRSGACVTTSALFDQADRALYESKHRGRDRVTHFRELGADPAPVSG